MCTAYLPDVPFTTGGKAVCRAHLTGCEKRLENLQNGKLAGFNDEYGSKHQANAGSKHGQGSK
jgi:hypothetical protein